MRPWSWFLIVSSAFALFVGASHMREMQSLGQRFGACEIRTFDHVAYLALLRQEVLDAKERLIELKKRTPEPLRDKSIAFYAAKVEALLTATALVEEQVKMHGSRYSCVEPGYSLLMYGLDFPSFNTMSREEEVERLWQRLQHAAEISVTRLLEIMLGPVVALVIGLLTLYGPSKREKRNGPPPTGAP